MSDRIIAFSLYGDDPKYREGMKRNIRMAGEHYPGWRVVIYATLNAPDFELASRSCTPDAEFSFLGDEQGSRGMFWRFQAAAASNADAILFRDADSDLNPREAAAVNAWLATDHLAHSMHDHRHHRLFPLHGGMWGVRGGVLPDIVQMIEAWHARASGHMGVKGRWCDDQWFLRERVYPRVEHSCLHHVCDELLANPAYHWGGERFPPHEPYNGFVGQQRERDGSPINPP